MRDSNFPKIILDSWQVFDRPESLGSTMALRDIITSEAEHDALTVVSVRTALARQALTDVDMAAEIEALSTMDADQPL